MWYLLSFSLSSSHSFSLTFSLPYTHRKHLQHSEARTRPANWWRKVSPSLCVCQSTSVCVTALLWNLMRRWVLGPCTSWFRTPVLIWDRLSILHFTIIVHFNFSSFDQWFAPCSIRPRSSYHCYPVTFSHCPLTLPPFLRSPPSLPLIVSSTQSGWYG